jgi:hypothetical protein
MNAHDEAEDLRLDWALGEKLGGERPPDLAAAIVQRHRRGDTASVPAGAPTTTVRGRWLAAALVLLGLGVVVAVALQEAAGDDASATPPEPPAEIHSASEARALPATTRAVIAHDCGDDAMLALAHLRDLESLEVRVHDHEVFGLMLKTQPRVPDVSITSAGLQAICNFSKLRRLVLSGTWGVRAVTAGAPGPFGELRRLPLLSDLTLRFFDVDDEVPGGLDVLPNLPELRRLDLSFNHGFGAAGMDLITRCSKLEALSLRGCQQLRGAWLRSLGELQALRELDVGLIDGINWRSTPPGRDDQRTVAVLDEARRLAQDPGTGVTDEALEGITRCRNLRRLDLSSSRFTPAGDTPPGVGPDELDYVLGPAHPARQQLPAVYLVMVLRELEWLDLSGNAVGDGVVAALPRGLKSLRVGSDRLTSGFCRELRKHVSTLEHLDVSACYGIKDDGVAELVRVPGLRRLELRQMYGLTAACIAHLCTATGLLELDVRHCDFVTAEHEAALRAALPDLRELQTSVKR